jgi:hypothetical protein
VAVVRNDVFLKLYVNGVPQSSIGPTITPNTEPALLGKATLTSSYDWPFNGVIDNVRVFGRALSNDEILVIYNLDCP